MANGKIEFLSYCKLQMHIYVYMNVGRTVASGIYSMHSLQKSQILFSYMEFCKYFFIISGFSFLGNLFKRYYKDNGGKHSLFSFKFHLRKA